MNYLTIDELKKQCIIDLDFTEDDDYLAALGDTAEALVTSLENTDIQKLELIDIATI